MKLGVSYFGNRMPRHFIDRDLPEIVDAGCTFVLHTFSEEDLEFYAGAVREMVAASKDAGLEVYLDPWGVAGVFGGETYSRFLLQQPEALQVGAGGRRLPIACPNAPALRAFMAHWTETAAGMGADVLFWDEPHFTWDDAGTGINFCRCDVCQRLYEARYGTAMPEHADPQVTEFQQESIVKFIDSLCQAGSAHGARNAVCLLPFDDAQHGLRQWERVAALPDVDILGVTPFWHLRGQEVRDYVRRWSAKVSELCQANGREAQVWLQAFLLDEGRERELSLAAEEAYAAGVRNFAAWGFRACEHISALRPSRPVVVWQELRDSFARLAIK